MMCIVHAIIVFGLQLRRPPSLASQRETRVGGTCQTWPAWVLADLLFWDYAMDQ